MSLWASPIIVVKKHTPEDAPQQSCLCIDYRKLNSLLPAVTPAMGTKKGDIECRFLIPLINDVSNPDSKTELKIMIIYPGKLLQCQH